MNKKGQALIEFVLILPVFLMILFAIVDFGLIFNAKSELENNSIDIIELIKNDTDIKDIESLYKDTSIKIKEDTKYTKVIITTSVKVMTPGLNKVLGDPYQIRVERTIPNV